MQLTRRALLALTGGLACAAPLSARRPDDSLGDTERRAADAIRGYAAEGDHRTATAVDAASADHLLALARATGATAWTDPFNLSRVDPIANIVEIDGVRIDGLPMFDGGFTDAAGVAGRLGPIDRAGEIAFLQTPPNGEAALRRIRAASRHRAIVAVTVGGRPGLCPVNAAWFGEPFGPPVLQVGSEHLEAIRNAAAAAANARIVAQATRTRALAVNVLAIVDGGDRELAPVCVMTPRSGWHANASERGGGLACWLEAMRAVKAARCARTVQFVASSGHELGHLGLRAHLDRNPGLARNAFAWVHLGANIGASTGGTRMTPSNEALAGAAVRALSPYGLGTIARTPAVQVAGEAATIQEQGGRFISFIGQNAWFHNAGDLWPDAVDVASVARFARGVADLTVTLANVG
jgi:hypothetical protein